jgi:hypothetical protein
VSIKGKIHNGIQHHAKTNIMSFIIDINSHQQPSFLRSRSMSLEGEDKSFI